MFLFLFYPLHIQEQTDLSLEQYPAFPLHSVTDDPNALIFASNAFIKYAAPTRASLRLVIGAVESAVAP